MELVFEYPTEPVSSKLDSTPDKPLGFGYKNAWIAIKADDPEKVAKALKISELRIANWRSGLAIADDYYLSHVFISPVIKGWVFVIGLALPSSGDSCHEEKCLPFLEEIGQTFDAVFFFCTHRIVEYHAWARVDKGKISRAYAYLGERGESIWNIGEKTIEEQNLKFKFFADEPHEGEGDDYWKREDLTFPDEDDVIKIAEAWTLNPLEFEEMRLPISTGFVGHIPTTWR
jgi:hypothetical protein